MLRTQSCIFRSIRTFKPLGEFKQTRISRPKLNRSALKSNAKFVSHLSSLRPSSSLFTPKSLSFSPISKHITRQYTASSINTDGEDAIEGRLTFEHTVPSNETITLPRTSFYTMDFPEKASVWPCVGMLFPSVPAEGIDWMVIMPPHVTKIMRNIKSESSNKVDLPNKGDTLNKDGSSNSGEEVVASVNSITKEINSLLEEPLPFGKAGPSVGENGIEEVNPLLDPLAETTETDGSVSTTSKTKENVLDSDATTSNGNDLTSNENDLTSNGSVTRSNANVATTSNGSVTKDTKENPSGIVKSFGDMVDDLNTMVDDITNIVGDIKNRYVLVWALYTVEVPQDAQVLTSFGSFNVPNSSPHSARRVTAQVRRAYLRTSDSSLIIPRVIPGPDKYSVQLEMPTQKSLSENSEEVGILPGKSLEVVEWPPCPPRLLEVVKQIHTILLEAVESGHSPFVGPLLSTTNWNPTNVFEASQTIDSVTWLLSGPGEEASTTFSILLEEVSVVARARLILKLLKTRYVHDRLGFTSKERKSHQRDLLNNLSRLTNMEHKVIIEKYKARAEELPETVKREVQGQINRLNPTSLLDFTTTRKQLDFIFDLPWKKSTVDKFDMEHAQKVLDSKHYGMKDVKDRVIELLAVNKLTGSFARGKVLGLVGPPGTGKTTVVESIAESLDRKFGQISIGGLWDMSDLKGHRKSYMGAMAGMIMKTIHRCGSNNPVILLDEIDKLTPGSQVGTALLEILDPSQQHAFTDVWLDIPFDLSNVLFVCTANWEESIHPALRDRLEVITLEGYLEEDKLQIAKKHLVPKCMKKAGLGPKELSITDGTLKALIKHYCPLSPGVRDLESLLQSLVDHCSLQIALGNAKSFKVTIQNYELMLSRDEFHKYEHDTVPVNPGCATALTRTAQQIECITYEPRGKHGSLHTTGKLDEVMQESASLAYTYITNLLGTLDSSIIKEPTFFAKNSVHLHLPKGGQEKGGTHAGACLALALFSLAIKRSIPSTWAVTGELTLHGKILPVERLQQKIHAARLHGINNIVLPTQNKPHWDELPESLRAGITVHFADWFPDIVKAVWNIDLPYPHDPSKAASLDVLQRMAGINQSPKHVRKIPKEKTATL